MKKFPKGGLIGKAVDAYLAIREKQIPLHAAYAGYFIILSVFPALLMVLRFRPRTTVSFIQTTLDFQNLLKLITSIKHTSSQNTTIQLT